MAESFQHADESRKYDEDCADKSVLGSEESNDGEAEDHDDEKNIQNLMRAELTRQLGKQDFNLGQEIQLPLRSAANEVSPSANTKVSTTPPSVHQEHRQRNFLVARLMDLNESNGENNFQLQQQQQQRACFNEQFSTSYQANKHDSLLTKLMLEHEQQREQSVGLRFDLDPIDEGGQQKAGALIQMNNQQQQQQFKQYKQGGGQRSHSTSGANNALDEQLKARNIDLDEHVKLVDLFGIQIVALMINGKERLCLAQISNTLLKDFSYNEIHNRRVALGITCVQCTPIQLEMLRRAGAMPSSSRRCGMITMREAERLCKSFLAEEQPPELPENFYFTVAHRVNYGCKGRFVPARYISSRAKCIECFTCGDFFSPNKFIFHSHKDSEATDCNPPDSPNINSWRKHINLDWTHEHSQEIKYAWEDVKSLFNGGTRRRTTFGSSFALASSGSLSSCSGDHHQAQDTTLNDEVSRQKTTNNLRTGKNSCPRSLSGGRKHGQQAAPQQRQQDQLMADGQETDIDVMVRDTRRSEQRSTPAPPLSQNERRKIPIGAWSRDRQKHQMPGDLQAGQSVSSFKRSSGHNHDKIAQQQHQIKRLATQDNWQQQQQHKLALAGQTTGTIQMSLTGDQQQNSLHRINGAFHPDTMSNQHQAAAGHLIGANQSNMDMSGLAGARNINSAGTSNCLTPADAMTQSIKSQTHVTSQTISSPGNFIYGQLYSQLMQTQLAQQVDQRRRQQQLQQQQQQMAPFDAQMALRQHIWSSLLANLRCNQTQLEQQQQQQPAGQQSFKSNQLPDYCLSNPIGQQQDQQTNSLLAAAAAAACATTSTTTANSNSSFLHHNSAAKQPGGVKEPSDLAPNLMHMYATNAQVNMNDVAAMFNGTNDAC